MQIRGNGHLIASIDCEFVPKFERSHCVGWAIYICMAARISCPLPVLFEPQAEAPNFIPFSDQTTSFCFA